MSNPPALSFSAVYHIYTRGTNKTNIFIEERNYEYFLKLYEKYIPPVAYTYAYCLLKIISTFSSKPNPNKRSINGRSLRTKPGSRHHFSSHIRSTLTPKQSIRHMVVSEVSSNILLDV